MKSSVTKIKSLLFFALLIPFLWMIYAVVFNALGPDPAKELAHFSGEWAIRILMLSLSVTPLRILTGKTFWIRYRRMLGLFAFFYVVLHLLIFIAFYLGFDLLEVLVELKERPYILMGFFSILLLLPLAITSTNRWRQKLGKRWLLLHKLVFPAMVFALIHVLWQVRSDYSSALIYIAAFVFLILVRLFKTKKISRGRV